MGRRIIRAVDDLPRPPRFGWKDEIGPNSASGSNHFSGWMVRSVGSSGYGADRFLLWTPAWYGPDETCTCKYRRCIYTDGRPHLFFSIREAIDYYEKTLTSEERRLGPALSLPALA